MNNRAEIPLKPVKDPESVGLIGCVGKLADRRIGKPGSHLGLAGDAPEKLLNALLVEIDETVLPRQLEIETDTGKTIEVLVSSRRLIGLSNSKSAECTDPRFVLDRLRATFDRASKASINTVRLENTFSRTHNGVSAVSLLAILSVKEQGHSQPNPIPTFFAGLQRQMLAWVTLSGSGRIHKAGGDTRWNSRLVELAKSQLPDLEAQRLQSQKTTNQPGCILLSFGDENGFILLYARSNTSGFLALLPAGGLEAIQSAWRARPT